MLAAVPRLLITMAGSVAEHGSGHGAGGRLREHVGSAVRGSRAQQLLCSMWDLSRSGSTPVLPALAKRTL